jgi:hypothetical protein
MATAGGAVEACPMTENRTLLPGRPAPVSYLQSLTQISAPILTCTEVRVSRISHAPAVTGSRKHPALEQRP